jgi:hypothetical protein
MKPNSSSVHDCKGKTCNHINAFSKFKKTKAPRQSTFGKCKKWTKVPVAIANDYNSHPTIMCKNCKSFTKNLYFLHDEDTGEYYCPSSKCEKMGNPRFICLKCNKKKNNITVVVEDDDSD